MIITEIHQIHMFELLISLTWGFDCKISKANSYFNLQRIPSSFISKKIWIFNLTLCNWHRMVFWMSNVPLEGVISLAEDPTVFKLSSASLANSLKRHPSLRSIIQILWYNKNVRDVVFWQTREANIAVFWDFNKSRIGHAFSQIQRCAFHSNHECICIFRSQRFLKSKIFYYWRFFDWHFFRDFFLKMFMKLQDFLERNYFLLKFIFQI